MYFPSTHRENPTDDKKHKNMQEEEDDNDYLLFFGGRPLPLLPTTTGEAAAGARVLIFFFLMMVVLAAGVGAVEAFGAVGVESGRRLPLLIVLLLPLSNIKFDIITRLTMAVTCICTTHPLCMNPLTPIMV